MNTKPVWRNRALSLITVALLAGCGNDSPEALLSSAKDYLAKNDSKAAVIQLKNALKDNPSLAEARFLLGKALLESGDIAGAEVELQKAVELKHPQEQVFPVLANAWLVQGQARKVVDEATKINPTTPDAKAAVGTTLGIAYATLGDLPKAQASIEQALKDKPDHDPALVAQARLRLAEKDLAGALQRLDAAVAANPKNAEAWTLKGDILGYQGQVDAAQTAYRKALESRPDNAPAHAALVTSLMRQGKLDEAGKQIEIMKKALPNNLQTLITETLLAYEKKDFPRAKDLIMAVQKNVPDAPGVLTLAGAIHLQLNSLLQAEDQLKRALQANPNQGLARRLLATLYLRTGQPGRAVDLLEPVLEQIGKNPEMLALAGTAYLQIGDPQKAEEYFSQAAQLAPADTASRTRLALAQMAGGKNDTAFDALEDIAATDKGITADMALISTAIRKKAFDRALAAIAKLDQKQPNSPVTHALRGTTLLAQGNVAAARQNFEKALAIKADYFPAAASLASLDLREKKLDAAKKRFETLIAANPKHAQALLALAEIEANTGAKPERVVSLINQAIKAAPDNPRPHLALIRYHVNKKDNKQALQAAESAVKALPGKPELLDAQGRLEQATGNMEKAIATFKALAALAPQSPQPLVNIADIHVAEKKHDEAIASLKKALTIKPDFLPAQRGLVITYLRAGRDPEAMAMAKEIQKQRQKEPIGYEFEGDIAIFKKSWPDAIQAYQSALKQAPKSTELAVKLHAAMLQAGKNAEADKFATSFNKSHANDLRFALHLAQSAAARGDHAGAAKQYQNLLRNRPQDPVLLNNLAWALGQMKDPRALDYAQKANTLAPDQPQILDTLATLLAQKGDTAAAMTHLQRALSVAPQNHLLQLSLAKIEIQAGKRAEARKRLEELKKLGTAFPRNAEVDALLKTL